MTVPAQAEPVALAMGSVVLRARPFRAGLRGSRAAVSVEKGAEGSGLGQLVVWSRWDSCRLHSPGTISDEVFSLACSEAIGQPLPAS